MQGGLHLCGTTASSSRTELLDEIFDEEAAPSTFDEIDKHEEVFGAGEPSFSATVLLDPEDPEGKDIVVPVMDKAGNQLNVKAQETDETDSSRSIQVREVVMIEGPIEQGNSEDRAKNSNMKSRDEDSTTPTTAKAVDNINLEKEETLLTKPLTKEQSKKKKKKY